MQDQPKAHQCLEDSLVRVHSRKLNISNYRIDGAACTADDYAQDLALVALLAHRAHTKLSGPLLICIVHRHALKLRRNRNNRTRILQTSYLKDPDHQYCTPAPYGQVLARNALECLVNKGKALEEIRQAVEHSQVDGPKPAHYAKLIKQARRDLKEEGYAIA